ncbi:hypothetical protein [Chryseobacterium sp. JV274]|uniref:hypothetical protein n=1 Tax=Chryseobacterium sp. JV274 TaxID=1932669 RepID=UPI000987CA7A|nr:hypothetical protein [Chryseobacterium sp. JV274]
MKTLILILALILLGSCSAERDQENEFKYLIQVNFQTGKVKEGEKELVKANNESSFECGKILKGETLTDGYTYKVLCMGSDGKGTSFMYVILTSVNESGYFLITYDEKYSLYHKVQDYDQASCLKRWIISN